MNATPLSPAPGEISLRKADVPSSTGFDAFEAAGDHEEVGDLGVFIDEFFDVRNFDDVFQHDVGAAGDEFGDFVGVLDGHAHDAADILDCGLGTQRVECDDLAHATAADDFWKAFDPDNPARKEAADLRSQALRAVSLRPES